jgi:hypothetical protein
MYHYHSTWTLKVLQSIRPQTYFPVTIVAQLKHYEKRVQHVHSKHRLILIQMSSTQLTEVRMIHGFTRCQTILMIISK